MDASVVETQKREARYSYRKRKAYQPLTTYWYEADLVLHSEFRDGNVPAGHEQLRVMREALGSLPEGVEQVRLRSDTAGYQRELLRYCAEGRDERFGVIEFAVGVDVTVEFKRAVVRVAEDQWQPVVEGRGQEWAEVNFVPNWVAQGKKEVVYRFLAIRERFEQARLPGMGEQWELPFPAMEMGSRGWYKVFGLVTNRELPGEEVIEWSRQRCGKGEEVHSVLKRDLAGGRLPSGKFGGNAAWWAMVVLAFNLNSIMKWLVWGGTWRHKRLKAIRFGLVTLGGVGWCGTLAGGSSAWPEAIPRTRCCCGRGRGYGNWPPHPLLHNPHGTYHMGWKATPQSRKGQGLPRTPPARLKSLPTASNQAPPCPHQTPLSCPPIPLLTPFLHLLTLPTTPTMDLVVDLGSSRRLLRKLALMLH